MPKRLVKVAVLCASGRSIYHHLPAVEVFDRARDACQFAGPEPVVAHPPCRLWSRTLSHCAKSLDAEAEKELGRFCVRKVLQNGGVLEQPAHSALFADMNLPMPNQPAHPFLFTLYVEQGWFGYPLRKPTWILVSGVPMRDIPPVPMSLAEPKLSFNQLTHFQKSRTVTALALWLCQIARASWWPLAKIRE